MSRPQWPDSTHSPSEIPGTVQDHALTQIAHARAQVERVKTLLSQTATHQVTLPLEERCADAIAAARGSGSGSTRAVAALEAAMADVAYTIRTTFLG